MATGEKRPKNDSGGEGTVHAKDIARIRKRASRRAAVREFHVYVAHL
jgi:hypothetical protein